MRSTAAFERLEQFHVERLLERELVSKQDLMARVWPDVFVEPANRTNHMSAVHRRGVTVGWESLHRQHPWTRLLFFVACYVGSR